MTVGEQAYVFAVMTAGGAALGMLYDVLALLRCALRAGGLLNGVLDGVYGLGCGVSAVLLALRMQAEAFRLYVLLGILLGLALYMGMIGAPVRVLAANIRMRVKKSRKMEEKCQNDAGKWETRANI
ncbi:MAG: hypothetical protein IKK34_03280 [Clostridia bacterium]|nr:hypothetical protein [Clostridia bacterium]